jgi:hypothetical protein
MLYKNAYNENLQEMMRKINQRQIDHYNSMWSPDSKIHHVGGSASKKLDYDDYYEGGGMHELSDEDSLGSSSDEMEFEEYQPNEDNRELIEATSYFDDYGIFKHGNARQAKKGQKNMGYDGGAYGSTGGFASGTHMDTGVGRTIGAGAKKYKKKVGKGSSGGGASGGGFFDDVWSGIKSVAKPIASVAKIGLSLVPDARAQMASKVLDAAGAGKRKVGRPKKVKVAKEVKMVKKVGRPKKMVGGTDLGIPYNMIRKNGESSGFYVKQKEVGDKPNETFEEEKPLDVIDATVGSGKKGKGYSGGKLVPKANMKSSSMGGMGKPSKMSARCALVKKIMKERNISMIEASKAVKKEKLY